MLEGVPVLVCVGVCVPELVLDKLRDLVEEGESEGELLIDRVELAGALLLPVEVELFVVVAVRDGVGVFVGVPVDV